MLALSGAQISAQSPAMVPWAAGERLEYVVRFAGFKAGTGIMEVAGIDTVRDRNAWLLHLNIKGGALGFHIDDTYRSWMDVESLNSLRFDQDLLDAGKHTVRNNEIFPDRRMFHREGRDEEKSVADPLDDASLLMFVRTLPLAVGTLYRFDRYFDPKANPILVKVLRKDTIDVPAGRFPAIVLQPSFNTNGLFSQNGHAEIWLSDDEHRILLRIDTRFALIKLGLKLAKVTYGTATSAPDSGKPH
jgi:hypothetical protein